MASITNYSIQKAHPPFLWSSGLFSLYSFPYRPGAEGGALWGVVAGRSVELLEQQFAWFEFYARTGADQAGGAVAGVAAGAFGLRPEREGTEVLEHDFATVFQLFAQDGEVGIQVNFALAFGNLQVCR